MGGVFLGRGHEAIAASQGVFLTQGKDCYAPFIREMAGHFAWGDSILDAARSYFGSVEGITRGRDGNVHWGKPHLGNPAPISHLGSGGAVIAGMMLAKRLRGESGSVGVICSGDGTTSTGAFHEAANLIAVEKLPIVSVITNNQFAYSTPNSQEFACESLNDRGKGYGMRTHECDGRNFLDTLSCMQRAIAAARAGEGPQWVLAHTLRACGHGEHDDAAYIPSELKEDYQQHNAFITGSQQLQEQGWMSAEEIEQQRRECIDDVQAQITLAQREASPNPNPEDWQAHPYIPPP